jgi:hypothetical protein
MRAARAQFGTDFVRILAEYDGRTFGFASKNFYKEFLAAREIVSDPLAYFPEGVSPEPPIARDMVTLNGATAASGVASRYKVPLAELASINPAWTSRAVAGRSPLPAGTRVWLPAGTMEKLARGRHSRRSAQSRPRPRWRRPTRSKCTWCAKGKRSSASRPTTASRWPACSTSTGLAAQSQIHPGQQLRIPVTR